MNQKTIVLFVVLFALIIAGMFMYAYLKKTELTEPATNATSTAETVDSEQENRYPNITRIDGTHYFIDGTHTVVGEILFPTPCDLLETNAVVAESFPEQITLEFDVINNADMCAQVVTPQRFKIEATASPDATFSARFMGRDIELNLKPAPEGEVPEDFEVFIKG